VQDHAGGNYTHMANVLTGSLVLNFQGGGLALCPKYLWDGNVVEQQSGSKCFISRLFNLLRSILGPPLPCFYLNALSSHNSTC
jgi:hypothetical protein